MLNVLVVERDPSLAWLYREELAEAGFAVGVCPNLDGARAWLTQNSADVVVTDLGSLGSDPDAWLPSLRRLFGGPVVFLGESRRRARGAPKVVPKTSDLSPLIASLRSHVLAASWNSAATC